jgi:glycosyltransferase involved in cell wall biosynthesis
MAENIPLVSIGMPVYNGERFIRQAVDSLLTQDYANFELIISDNASTDLTQQICVEYLKKTPRIKYYRNQVNIGSARNFSRVFSLAQGEYFFWASCHDLCEPTFISRCAEVLKHNSKVVLCYPLADWVDVNGDSLGLIAGNIDTRSLDRLSRCHVVLWGLQYAYPIYGVIRANVLRQTKILRATIGADAILLFELSLLGEFAQVPEVLLHIRRMPDYGSWDNYIEKSFNKQVRGLSRRMLFWNMLFGYLHAVGRQIHKIPAKLVLMSSVIFCVLVRYRGLRRSLSKSK